MDRTRPKSFSRLRSAWTVIRVLAITGIWTVVFLGILIGYLTIPILLMGVLLIAYAAFDSIRLRAER